ncbi:hypothetical protein V6N11_051416 [Hibiscus sabdariffa]|uniref:Uncharacterized protein n=1 Tax=Hibiscus sabdariffa TaxID=183260 RepID=A0ABR2U706_9ROSI
MSLRRLPILHRFVSKSNNLVRIAILRAKTKNRMIQKLVFLKKSRKLKRFKLVKHQNYGYLGEYQFDSPSSTPLIHHKDELQFQNRSIQDIVSMLLWCKCFGRLKAQVREEADHVPAEMDFEDGHDSVDDRAERFIENFYAEMRLQSQDSF